jgi:hypothetical protein
MSKSMDDKAFAGQRTVTCKEAASKLLEELFHKHALHKVVLIGSVASHLRCGLLEAEGLLELMVKEGLIRYANEAEKKETGIGFGYVRDFDEALAKAS